MRSYSGIYRCRFKWVFSSVGNGFEYRIEYSNIRIFDFSNSKFSNLTEIRTFEYSILSNSKFSNLTDIRKCRIHKSNYSKNSNIRMKLIENL